MQGRRGGRRESKGPTVGRHIEELDEFYVDVPESPCETT